MAIYEFGDVLANDIVIYPSNSEIQLEIGTFTLARFKLMTSGGEYIYKDPFFVALLGGHNNYSIVTKYRLRPRFDEPTFDVVTGGYYYLTYDIQYYTTIGGGDPGYDTGYFNFGAIEFTPSILGEKVKMMTTDNQKVSIIPRQMKTIDLNNSGTFRINNQTMSLK